MYHININHSAENSYSYVQDSQLQQIVDKTIMEADLDGDGKLSFEEFTNVVAKTVRTSFLLVVYTAIVFLIMIFA